MRFIKSIFRFWIVLWIFSCKPLYSSIIELKKAPSHNEWSKLLHKHVSENGNVNYAGFQKDSSLLYAYLQTLQEATPNENLWTQNEQKAFWINAYNAFTIKLILKYYPIQSIKDIGSSIKIPFINTPWDIKFIKINQEKLDLNNIEHSKLRNHFKDARIHFALVCASVSCPVLLNEAYIAEKLDEQLDAQARIFIKDMSRNILTVNEIKISKIFEWYSMDFTSYGVSIIDYINQYAPIVINANAKISYIDYNWRLNE